MRGNLKIKKIIKSWFHCSCISSWSRHSLFLWNLKVHHSVHKRMLFLVIVQSLFNLDLQEWF